ncbi:MAG: glycosyltransferase family 4 protein [Lachnospiraceae bacterium]|nr:glycosyltransferase family 4 protein [Lachnospiraceae bacterium]
MKKIIYLMEYPIDLPGGAQMSTFSVCEGLALRPEAGYEPVVICPKLLNHSVSDYSFRILEYDMGENRLYNLSKRIKAFKHYITTEKPDLIHIEMSESLITYGFIRRAFKNIPYIYTDRGLLFGYRKRSRIFMDPVLKGSKMLVTTTEFNKGLWTEGSDIRPITTIYNTISSKHFGNYNAEKRKEHEIPVIGMAGRICIEKDWPFACDFIDELASSGTVFKVDIVLSTFEKGDDLQVKEILSRLQNSVGADNVTLREDLTQAEMADYYYGVDIFLMTSQFESFGKAAVEAMSRKCAVVSTSVGGLPEVIGLDENLYTKADINKGVRAVKRLIEDKEKLNEQREFFYNRYIERYTEEKYIERHITLYNELTG